MKKFFEKYPLVHFTTVLTIIAIACGLLIGLVNMVTSPIIAENEKQATLTSYSEVMSGLDDFEELSIASDPSSIVSKVKAFDASDAVIGYIYKGYMTNGYGDMTIVMGINPNGVIVGAQFLTLNQTLHLDYTRANLQLFVGTNIADLTPSGDLQSGATYSRTTMMAILSDFATSFEDTAEPVVELDPYEEMFGVDYVLTDDATFTAVGEVLSRQTATDADSNFVGYLYKVTGNGIYDSYEEEYGDITIYVGLDSSNNILGVYIPEDEYEHSAGSRYDKVVSYTDTLAGTSISAFDASTGSDLTTGATNSKTLVDELLTALKGVVIPE